MHSIKKSVLDLCFDNWHCVQSSKRVKVHQSTYCDFLCKYINYNLVCAANGLLNVEEISDRHSNEMDFC